MGRLKQLRQMMMEVILDKNCGGGEEKQMDSEVCEK